MSTTTTTSSTKKRATAKQQTLLGHPQVLATADVQKRRERLAGLPISQAEARTFGASCDLLVGEDGFAVNVCDLVVSDLVSALNVLSVDTAEAGRDSDTATAMWEAWQRSELAANTEGLFTSMACDGQAFLVCDFTPDGKPTAYVNAAYDGDTGIQVVGVDSDGRLSVAIKHEVETLMRDTKTGLLQRIADWTRSLLGMSIDRAASAPVERRIRTEYAFDRFTGKTAIRTFVKDEGSAERQAWQFPETGEWQDVEPGFAEEWPWGNPVIPFVAPGGGELSEMETPQRLVNAAALDLAAAARLDGLRLVYTINCKPLGGGVGGADRDDVVYMKPGAFFELAPANPEAPATVGALPPADLGAQMENFRLQVETALLIGRATYGLVPWQAVGIPSGIAIRLINRSFDSKLSRYQERMDDSLGQLFDVWQRMGGIGEPEAVTAVWRKPAYTTRSEDLADAQAAEDLGLPRSYTAGEVLGMTPEEAGAWDDEQQAGTDRMLATAAALTGAAQAVPMLPGQTVVETNGTGATT